MTISLTQEGKIWIVRSAFADKDIVKAAGARWNPDRKCWWTDKPEVAEKLAQGDAAAVAAINAERQAAHERAQRAVDASRATDAAIDLPRDSPTSPISALASPSRSTGHMSCSAMKWDWARRFKRSA